MSASRALFRVYFQCTGFCGVGPSQVVEAFHFSYITLGIQRRQNSDYLSTDD
jgi:hypothetical protein